MKKINSLMILALSVLIFSCTKEKVLNPALDNQSPAVAASQTQTTNLPVFDEKNTKAIPFDQFPDKLKNATELPTIRNSSSAPAALSNVAAERISAYYKYFLGTWGGNGGSGYSIYPAGSGDRIYAIGFRAGSYVDALFIWYLRPDGSLYYHNVGGNGGNFYIQYLSEGEYISAIWGRSGAYIDRLGFNTNYKSFSYGGNGGGPFYAPAGPYDQILGFFGGSGVYVDRIGAWVYSRP
jgi:hypothetical protein